jgi:hypothetical protein
MHVFPENLGPINIHKTGYDLFSVHKISASIKCSTPPLPLPMYPHHPGEHSEEGSSELGK